MVAYTVIVADRSGAGIYRLPTPGGVMRKLEAVQNPAGHRHERDLGSDAPGRVLGWGGVRHAYAPRHTLQQHATETFARAVIGAAQRAAGRRATAEVLLVAAPGLRGTLRRFMPKTWRVTVMPLGLTKVPAAELRRRVVKFLSGPPERPRRVWYGAA
jgi:protein required for attachment to host cells